MYTCWFLSAFVRACESLVAGICMLCEGMSRLDIRKHKAQKQDPVTMCAWSYIINWFSTLTTYEIDSLFPSSCRSLLCPVYDC
jgi:hypothetical protein